MSASDLARKRAFAAWASRVQLQFDRKRLYEQTEQPALAAEGGKVKPLGAAGPIRPRGNISSGAQPVGTPVSQSQGLINSPQAASTDDSGLRVLKDAIAAVALGRGIQTGEGDPIDPAGDGSQPAVVARYPGDSYLDTATNALYRWKAGTAEEAGEWVAFYQALMGNGAPTVDGVASPAFYWDEVAKSLYVWDGQWNEISSEEGNDPPILQAYSPTIETAAAGTTWINTLINRTWIYSGTAWVPNGNKLFFSNPGNVNDLEVGDTLLYGAGFLAAWTGATWQKLVYCGPPCENEPPEPPEPPGGGGTTPI